MLMIQYVIVGAFAIMGLWMLGYVFYPRIEEFLKRCMSRRIENSIARLEMVEEHQAKRRAARIAKKMEEHRSKLAAIAAGEFLEELDKEEAERLKAQVDIIDPEEQMRRLILSYDKGIEVIGNNNNNNNNLDDDDIENQNQEKKKHHRKNRIAPGTKIIGETPIEFMSIAQLAKARMQKQKDDAFAAFKDKMTEAVTVEMKEEKGRKTFRAKLRANPVGFQMPLGKLYR